MLAVGCSGQRTRQRMHSAVPAAMERGSRERDTLEVPHVDMCRGWWTSPLRSNKVTKLQLSARPAHDPSHGEIKPRLGCLFRAGLCRASVSPQHSGFSPTTQRPEDPGEAAAVPGRAAARQAALLG